MTQLTLDMGANPPPPMPGIDPVEACQWVPRDGPRPRPAAFIAYWRWMGERMRVFKLRHQGAAPPWTSDVILAGFKFCNAYRVLDRLSQLLVEALYDPTASAAPRDLVARVLLFRFFNRAETWQLICESFGTPDASVLTRYTSGLLAVLDGHVGRGGSLFGTAYTHAPPRPPFRGRKHHGYVALAKHMIESGVAEAVQRAPSLKAVYDALVAYPMIGRFVGYQLATDINYSSAVDFDENTFTMAGPGAVAGIGKCFVDAGLPVASGGMSPEAVIRWMTANQEAGLRAAGYDPASVWLPGRPFKLIDVQNGFCEVGKYLRVAMPELAGCDGRTKIKARFGGAASTPIRFMFPPKWGVTL